MIDLYEVLKIAEQAHKNQFRRSKTNKKIPYIIHSLRVAMMMTTDEEKAVALLHDSLEDGESNGVTIKTLKQSGLPSNVIDAVVLLTHHKDIEYSRYIEYIKINGLARKVKIYDIKDNLMDEHTQNQEIKYAGALAILL